METSKTYNRTINLLDKYTKFIKSINTEDIGNNLTQDKLIELEYKADSEGKKSGNIVANVGDVHASDMSTAKNAIDNRHTYTVTTELSGTTGLINKIIITY